MRKRIENLTDVQLLVRSFYNKVLKDDRLSPFFSSVKSSHWQRHLEVMDSFWSNVLFYTGDYNGNPFDVHKTMHRLKGLDIKDLERWMELFNETMDDLFEGEKAELAKQRALSIAAIMRIDIIGNDNERSPG
jgi:hemoglobin